VELSQIDCVSDLVINRSNINSDGTAFLGEDKEPLTFGQLHAQMDYVLQRLNRMGIGRNDRVAIVLPNGPELAVAFLSIATCATSAPLNPGYSEAEFEFYLSDLKAKALVLLRGQDSPSRKVASNFEIPVIELIPRLDGRAISFDLIGEEGSPPSQSGYSKGNDVALILHTSGTTSRPKMVPLTHQNICASARHINNSLKLSSNDRCLNVMPLFHIHGLMAVVLSSVMAGASVACTSGFDPIKFYAWLQLFRPSWYSAVPTMHQAVLSLAKENLEEIEAYPLRLIRSSSASLPSQVMAELETVFKVPVIEAYGMTEAAHQMASNPLPPLTRKPGSVGLPAGPEIAIMNDLGDLLSGGEKGEIVIRGPNVMQGYAENPEANKTAFKAGWFRTGDEGYFDTEGYLFISGRIKEMINRGGEKIAPREVDEVFLEHPSVAQAVTFAVPHPTLGEDVATAVVLKPGESLTVKELRQFGLAHLVPQKAPSRVLILDNIPKGPTGKLQRIGLFDKLSNQLETEFEEPETEIEKILADFWIEILNREPIGIHDNFFFCGGDSLLATRLIARMRAAFQIELPIGSIFQDPTIFEQANRIEQLLIDEVEEVDVRNVAADQLENFIEDEK
jgi:acyl-CoA synthetase (AMP-forming)/AMP-acid ligase II